MLSEGNSSGEREMDRLTPVSATFARRNLIKLVQRTRGGKEGFLVVRYGEPTAVILSTESKTYQKLLRTEQAKKRSKKV